MRKVNRIEIWKAFHNRMFLTALLVGTLFNVIQVGKNFLLAKEYLYNMDYTYMLSNGRMWGGGDLNGMSVFANWMGADEGRLESVIFWFILPLLAAMPYGAAALSERKSRYQNQMVIRCGRRQGAAAKYLAAFLSGGFVAVIPVLMNFLLCAMFMPMTKPVVTNSYNGISESQFGSLLFFEYPLLFVLLVLAVVFLWGGTFGGMALAAGQIIRSKVFTIVFPFVFCILTEVFFATGIVWTSLEVSPRQLFHILSIRGTSGIIIFGEVFLLTGVSFLVFWIKEIRYEGI